MSISSETATARSSFISSHSTEILSPLVQHEADLLQRIARQLRSFLDHHDDVSDHAMIEISRVWLGVLEDGLTATKFTGYRLQPVTSASISNEIVGIGAWPEANEVVLLAQMPTTDDSSMQTFDESPPRHGLLRGIGRRVVKRAIRPPALTNILPNCPTILDRIYGLGTGAPDASGLAKLLGRLSPATVGTNLNHDMGEIRKNDKTAVDGHVTKILLPPEKTSCPNAPNICCNHFLESADAMENAKSIGATRYWHSLTGYVPFRIVTAFLLVIAILFLFIKRL